MSEREAPGKLELSVAGEVYRCSWSIGIKAELERFSEHRDELTAELTVYSTRPPRAGLLHSARFNLMSSQARSTLAKALASRDDDLDWYDLIESMCFVVRERYRNGEPSIDMRDYTPTGRPRWLIEPFLEHGGPTVFFGDGDSGKTMMAIAIAVTCATGIPVFGQLQGEPGPVLYVDYETDEETFYERLTAICAGAGVRERPPIYYRRQGSSLRDAAPSIRREIDERRIRAVTIDALGQACGDDPQAPDVVLGLFNVIRSFRVPTLGVDHVAKNASDQGKAFGSVYKHNGPRVTWLVEKAQEEGASSFVVALVNKKRNNGIKRPRLGYRIECESQDDESLVAVRFRGADLAVDFPEKASLPQRILAELGHATAALQPAELVERLGARPDQIRARLRDLRRDERVVALPDGSYALRSRSA
ncbi:MAG TPA: AAA family ATPase [Candidatus Limnocylindria bacterium]|jgi:hypothetical protein|nr:AAA family ATPase [Candidatus Limnocylindria bacterium]